MPDSVIIYLLLLLASSVIGIVRFSRLTIPFKVLNIQIILIFLIEIISYFVAKIYRNNMPVMHLSVTVEYMLFALMYYYLLTNGLLRKLVLLCMFLMFIFELVNITFFANLLHYPSLPVNIAQFQYVTFALLLFREMLLNPVERSIFKQSIFWFNLDILFYATALFLYDALASYFIKNNLRMDILGTFNYIINMLFYTVIGICIFINNRKATHIERY